MPALLLAVWTAVSARAGQPRLDWDSDVGLKLHADSVHIILDRDERQPSLLLRFWPNGAGQTLDHPEATPLGPGRLRLVYRAEAPLKNSIQITREITVRAESPNTTVLSEQFTLSATQPIHSADVEIVRPFMIESDAPITSASEQTLILPRVNGWAEVTTIGQEALLGEYRLGSPYPREPVGDNAVTTHARGREEVGALPAGVPVLALPLVQAAGPGWRCAVMADPNFGALFEARQGGSGVTGSVRCRYGARQVALTRATRTFAFRLQTGIPPRRPFESTLEGFGQLMAAGPPAPAWLRQIAMVQRVDFSGGGQAFERDLRQLAQWLTPAERGQVAMVIDGWYNAIFPYSYDRERGAFEKAWLASGDRGRWLSPEDVRHALRLARGLGFRVLLTLGEGLSADTGTPYFPAAWAWRDEKGRNRPAPAGSRASYGPLVLLNPAEPAVGDWFLSYTGALLAVFGKDVDGFVMPGAGQTPLGARVNGPRPAWADCAMLALTRTIHARINTANPELAFLAGGGGDDAPLALAADGSLGTTDCDPEAAVQGLFACAWGVRWDSARDAMGRFPESLWCMRTLKMPLAVSSGRQGEGGPAKWTIYQRDRIMKAFHHLRRHLANEGRTVYLAQDPENLLRNGPHRMAAGDAVTSAGAGELNWVLDRWTRVTASSEQAGRPAVAAARDNHGTGWASAAGRGLPQWLEADFGQPRWLTRCVVTAAQDERVSTATAGNLGLLNYDVQAWDEGHATWRTLAGEDADWAVKTRVYAIDPPVMTAKVRLLVNEVAPLDGVVRVMSFAAWGPGSKEKLTIIDREGASGATTGTLRVTTLAPATTATLAAPTATPNTVTGATAGSPKNVK